MFGRAGRPCRRCGTRIELGEQGPAGYERITYWCPRCQPGPAAARRHGAGQRMPAELRAVRAVRDDDRARAEPRHEAAVR